MSLSKPQLRSCLICPYRGTTGLYRFPTNELLREQWMDVCKVQSVKSSHRLCENHFKPSDFLSMNENHERKRLAPLVIPSQKLPIKDQNDNHADHTYSSSRSEPTNSRKHLSAIELENKKLKKDLSSAREQIESLQKKISRIEKPSNVKAAREKIVRETLADSFTTAQLDILLNVSLTSPSSALQITR